MLLNMVFTVKLLVGLTSVITLLSCITMVLGDEVKSFDFDVKPGGARNHFETEQWVNTLKCSKWHICPMFLCVCVCVTGREMLS